MSYASLRFKPHRLASTARCVTLKEVVYYSRFERLIIIERERVDVLAYKNLVNMF